MEVKSDSESKIIKYAASKTTPETVKDVAVINKKVKTFNVSI